MIGLVAASRHLARQAGVAGAAAVVAGLTAILVAAVFAVQMAVDGVALKGAVDNWVGAAEADRQAAFLAAEAVRWTEKGLSAFFQLLNGIALLTLGLAMVLRRLFPRWLGWVGVIAGLAALPGSVVVAYGLLSDGGPRPAAGGRARRGLPHRHRGGHVAQRTSGDDRPCLA